MSLVTRPIFTNGSLICIKISLCLMLISNSIWSSLIRRSASKPIQVPTDDVCNLRLDSTYQNAVVDIDESVFDSRRYRWNGHQDAVPLIELDRSLSFLLKQFEADVVFQLFAVKCVNLGIGDCGQRIQGNVWWTVYLVQLQTTFTEFPTA